MNSDKKLPTFEDLLEELRERGDNTSIVLSEIIDKRKDEFINQCKDIFEDVNVRIIQIDSSNITPVWSGPTGNVGTGTINGKDLYTFNIIKTAANTYTVLATRIGFV